MSGVRGDVVAVLCVPQSAYKERSAAYPGEFGIQDMIKDVVYYNSDLCVFLPIPCSPSIYIRFVASKCSIFL